MSAHFPALSEDDWLAYARMTFRRKTACSPVATIRA